MTNSKPAYGDLEKRIEALEEELSFQRQSAGREFYEKFIDAAAGNGIEMLTEVGYEIAAHVLKISEWISRCVIHPMYQWVWMGSKKRRPR